MVLTLEQKMARMQLQVLTATDDAHLTAEQLKQKNDTSLRPHSPSAGLKARHSAMHTLQHTQSFSTLRCFACDTALRDPGVGWFSCGACGALNGEDEPRISRAFDGCIFRGMCRRLSRHGRLVVLAVLGIIGIVIYEGVTAILPILVDESPWTRASLMHGALTAFLAAGTVFNYGAAVLTSPGYVTTEINPLRLLEHEVAVDCGGGGCGGEAWSAATAATSASSGRPAAASTPCKRRGDAAAAAAAAAARDVDGVSPCELSDARSRDAPPLPSALPSPRGSCAADGDGSFGDGDGAAANGGGSCGYGGAGGGCGGGGGGGGGGGSAAADTPLARLVALRGEQPLRGWKRCRESGVSMPPRSHYCRTSRAVVLRMDHFCMFTNGTIGHRNHHYFLSFLGFAFAATLYALAASGYAVAATAPPRAALLNGTDLAAAIGHHPAVHALAAASAAPAAAAATAATLTDGATRQRQPQQQPQQPRQPQEQPPQEQQGGRLLQQAVAASPYGLPGAIALGGLGPAGLPYGLLYRLFSGLVVRWPLLGSAATLWCACLPTALFTGTLLLVQLRNLRRGLTYIESCRTPPPTEYDLGPRRNFGQVFGSWSRRDGGRRGDGWRTLLHLLPVPRPPVGDGIHFATRAPVRRV